MHFKFNLSKTVQAAAELLRHEPSKQMSRLRLIKLLYIADRESLRETGRPISCDTIVAMKHGPVLSRFYNVIKGEDAGSSEFNKYIEQQGFQLFLVNDPGKDNLNRYEIRKLRELSDRHRDDGDWELVEITHGFPEWIKNDPGESSQPIPIEDVLEAIGFSDERIESVRRDAADVRKLQRLFHQR